MSATLDAMMARTAALRAPIPGANPWGDDISFDGAFEKVKAEIEKLESIDGTLPNWREVMKGSTLLLTTRSKDLRLVTWLTVAKMYQEGWDGLSDGLLVYRDIVRDYWSNIAPDTKRPRARANLFGWFTERVHTTLDSESSPQPAWEVAAECDALFQEIDGIFAEKLGDHHPGPGRLRTFFALRGQPPPPPPPPPSEPPPPAMTAPGAPRSVSTPDAATQTEAAPEAAPEPPPVSIAPPTEPPPVAVDVPIDSAEAAVEAMEKCAARIFEAAAFLRREELASPWTIRLQRAAMWLALRRTPESAIGRTQTLPPSPSDRDRLGQLFEKGDFEGLLQESESVATSFPLWLDLQRFASLAMERLGRKHEQSREVLVKELTTLIAAHPTLPQLAFQDGTPFADTETRAWLETLQTPSDDGLPPAARARVAAARQAITNGRTGEGIGALVSVARGGNARTAFRINLLAAQLAVDVGKHTLARPLLEGLLAQADKFQLDSWEPELCVTLYASFIECLRSADPPIVDAAAREALLFDRLCRLDPALAARLGGL